MSNVFERVEIEIADELGPDGRNRVIVYDITETLARQAAEALREWLRTKDEEAMLRKITALCGELSESLPRLRGEALRMAVEEKILTRGERKALAKLRRAWEQRSKADDQRAEAGLSLSFDQTNRLAEIFHTFARDQDYDAFDYTLDALKSELFGPLHNLSNHGALFQRGMHFLTEVECNLVRQAVSRAASMKVDSAVSRAMWQSFNWPCLKCTYIHVGAANPWDRCRCPCHCVFHLKQTLSRETRHEVPAGK